MSTYKPAIGQINFNLSTVDRIQNIFNVVPGIPTPSQPVDESVTPISIAQYCLYDTTKVDDNYGLDDALYLGYKGGFITQDNKINTKIGNFTVANNLTVRKNTRFFKNIDLQNNRITHLQRKGSAATLTTIAQFVNSVYNTKQNDNDVMTVGDFREFRFVKGTIMMWTGSYESLVDNLPYWRLCAPPDSGAVVNGVTVPNLEGHFVIAGGYDNVTGGNYYQPTAATYNLSGNIDNLVSFGSPIQINIGTTGGSNGIALTLNQIPIHNHGISFQKRNNTGQLTLSSQIYGEFREGTFTYFRKPVSPEGVVEISSGAVGRDSCTREEIFTCENGCGSKQYTCKVNPYETTQSVRALSFGSSTSSEPNIIDGSCTSTIASDNVGGSLAHDNRPTFTVLGYIIYVGQRRT